MRTIARKIAGSSSRRLAPGRQPAVQGQDLHPVLRMQRAVGNQAVLGLVRGGVLQRMLAIGEPGDVYEQEAERVAAAVTRTAPGPVVRRRCACGGIPGPDGECAACRAKRLARRRQPAPGDIYEREANRIDGQVMTVSAHYGIGVAPLRIQGLSGQSHEQTEVAPASVDQVLVSPGRPLEPALRQDMERRFGYDFSRVRLHSGEAAAQSARDVSALAYTVGHNIVFGAGRLAPNTYEGRRLIAHELTHVVQQSTASAPPVVHRQAGGGTPAGGAPAGVTPVGGTPPLSVKYNGCGTAPYTQTLVDAAARAAYNQVVSTNCIRSQELKDRILSEFANLTIDCEQGGSSSPCGMAPGPPRVLWSHTMHIYPRSLTSAGCGPLASTILHEVVHLTELRLIEHGDLADACEASCFGWGSGDPAKCSEETLVRHGPRFALGLRSSVGGSGALGRFGYEVIRSWTGAAMSIGLRLDVPLTDRASFVRAGLEVGTNFQLLGSLYGRLFGGFAVPLPPGIAHPSMFVGAGLGLDFGRAQLEVLYDVLDVQSRDERTHQLMLGVGFRFGK